jgi:hypothetical protein
MLDLSPCTLLFVETRAHKITKRVIDDCLTKAEFGEVLIFTDNPDLIPVPGARYIAVPDFPDKKQAGKFYYGEAMASVNTDFALMMEWDAGIFDPAKWRPEFLNYDYIGAPWVRPAGDHQNVGNGGFTLMSKRLGQYAVQNFRRWPVYTDWDFCRLHRGKYEAAGFKWPEGNLASMFSWELGPRNPNHFGYHGAFTWPTVLSQEEVIARCRLMLETEYLTVKSRQLFQKAPWLSSHLTPEELLIFHTRVPPGHVLRPSIPGGMTPQQRHALLLLQQQMRTVPRNQGQKA